MTAALDAVARAALAAPLKAAGFRKTGRTWRRRVGPDDAIQIVNLQGSMFSSSSHPRCALNVAVYFPRLAELLGTGRVTDGPSEADAHLRKRAAMLAPDGHDTWFEFDAADAAAIDRAAAAVYEVYAALGAPWLDRVAALDEARNEFARAREFRHAAAASLALRDAASATHFMTQALNASSAATRPFLLQWATRHSLLADHFTRQADPGIVR